MGILDLLKILGSNHMSLEFELDSVNFLDKYKGLLSKGIHPSVPTCNFFAGYYILEYTFLDFKIKGKFSSTPSSEETAKRKIVKILKKQHPNLEIKESSIKVWNKHLDIVIQ